MNLLTTSIEPLKPLERYLIFNILLINKIQLELTEDAQLSNQFGITNISPAKINHLFQATCLKLLELLKFNQIKNERFNLIYIKLLLNFD